MPTNRMDKFLFAFSMFINISMVAIVYFATINELIVVALVALGVSKWRILAAHPRFWGRNLLNNACDIAFSASVISLLYYYQSTIEVVYVLIAMLALWQVWIKVMKSPWAVGFQGFLCLLFTQTAIWTYYPDAFELGLGSVALSTLAAAISCYHVLRQNEAYEGRVVLLTLVWAAVFSQLSWIGWLWNLQYPLGFYSFYIPQMTVIGGLTGYYLYSVGSIKKRRKRDQDKIFMNQTVFYGSMMSAVIILSDWSARIN